MSKKAVQCGIYKIENAVNGRCYYGSSSNIVKRWTQHRCDLKRNEHHNIFLQRSWNKHGAGNFRFEVVELCDVSDLHAKESPYLMLKGTYNIGKKPSGGDNLTKHPNRKAIIAKITAATRLRYNQMTEEEKKQRRARCVGSENPNWRGGTSVKTCACGNPMDYYSKGCQSCCDRTGENNSFFGRKHTTATKRKLSEANKGRKPSHVKPYYIGDTLYLSLKDGEKATGTPGVTIRWRVRSKNPKYTGYRYTEPLPHTGPILNPGAYHQALLQRDQLRSQQDTATSAPIETPDTLDTTETSPVVVVSK